MNIRIVLTFFFILWNQFAFASPQSFSYQGRILDANGDPLESSNVVFRFTLVSPDGVCNLWTETKSAIDMTNSGGIFDLTIGPSASLATALENGTTHSCLNSGNYTGSGTAGRLLKVEFNSASSGWKEISPNLAVNSVPYANVAAKLGNKTAADFIARPGTCASGQSVYFDGTNFVCQSLVAGDIPNIDAAKITSGTIVRDVLSTNVSAANGQFTNLRIYDGVSQYLTMNYPSAGAASYSVNWPAAQGASDTYLRNDGAGNLSWSSVASGSGTVTNVTSANSFITVTNGATAPVITAVVGSAANTLAAGNDARFTDSRTPSGAASGDLSGTYPSPTVSQIQGRAVTSTLPTDGQAMLWDNGLTTWRPEYIRAQDLRNAWGGTQMIPAAPCAVSESMTWSAVADRFTCQSIGSLNASVISVGLINTARLGTGTADSTTFLRGDGTWQVVAAGSGDILNGGNNGTAVMIGTNNNFNLSFETNGTEKVTILPSGNVGVGTSAPTSTLSFGGNSAQGIGVERASLVSTGQSLTVRAGAANSLFSNQAGGDLILSSGISNGTAASTIQFQTPTGGASSNTDRVPTTAMTIAGGGRVGIGTSTPGNQFHIRGATSSGILNSQLRIDDASGIAGIYLGNNIADGRINMTAYTGNLSSLDTFLGMEGSQAGFGKVHIITGPGGAGTPRITADRVGNVGIGTTAPDSILDVNGAFSQRGMALPAVSPTGQGRIYFDSTTNKFRVSQNGSAYTDMVSVGGSGDILNGGNSVTSSMTIGTNDPFALNFETDGTPKMTVLPSGLVGIGTVNPLAHLTVRSPAGDVGSINLEFGNFTHSLGQDSWSGSLNSVLEITGLHQSQGGAVVTGYGNAGGSALMLRGAVNTETPTNAPTVISGGKWNGSATTANIGATEKLVEIQNNDLTPYMTVMGSGNVGIGNTNPGAKLELGTAGTSLGTLRLAGSSSGYVQLQPSANAGSWNMTLPAGAGSNGQVLTTNGSGVTSWTTIASSGGDIINGGNTTGSAVVIGTDDANNLSLETTNSPRVTITAAGDVGIGTASPNSKLTVAGAATSRTSIIPTGATVDLALSNSHLLKSVGGAVITLQNFADGGTYTLYVSDLTSRIYTFSGCTNTYYSPANSSTTFRSAYTISVLVDGANTDCYISWQTGFN